MFKMNTPRNHKGFTLAETLITLVVIGVVAALTIPNIIVNHQKEETVTRLKKTYSAFSQITNRAVADNGPIKTWTIEEGKTKEFVDKYMAPYLSVAKNCGYETEGDCHFEGAYLKTPNEKNSYGSSTHKMILSDGVVVLSRVVISNGQNVRQSFLRIYVDINGYKGPNVFGKDIFYFVYWIVNDWTISGGKDYSGYFLPYGGLPSIDGANRENYKTWGCNKNGTGYHCSALIMADNWEIKDDYPW